MRNKLANHQHQLGSESFCLGQPRESESHLRLAPGTEERLGRRLLRNLQLRCQRLAARCESEACSKRRERIEPFAETHRRLPPLEWKPFDHAIQILQRTRCEHSVLCGVKSDHERPSRTREQLYLPSGELHSLGLLGQSTPRKFARRSNADECVVEIDRGAAGAHPGAGVVRSIVRQDVERHALEPEFFEEPFRGSPVCASNHEIYVRVRTGLISIEPIAKRGSFEENHPDSRVGESGRYASRESVERQTGADPAKTICVRIHLGQRPAILAYGTRRKACRDEHRVTDR